MEIMPAASHDDLVTIERLAHKIWNEHYVRMDRAEFTKAHIPEFLPRSFEKKDGMPDVEFEDYKYFTFPMDRSQSLFPLRLRTRSRTARSSACSATPSTPGSCSGWRASRNCGRPTWAPTRRSRGPR